jgi:two-component system, NarL family, response regulator NreC
VRTTDAAPDTPTTLVGQVIERADNTITVVLADDHEVVREGLRMVLETEADIEVVAEAADVDGARRAVLGHKPDVVILDLNMPGGPSTEAIPHLSEISPATAAIVLTMQTDLAFARKALASGAQGYVIKHSAAGDLVDAIRAAALGETYLSPQLSARLASESAAPAGPPDELTPRELEILRLLTRCLTNPEIAEQLVISVRTVETHRANLQRKTGCQTRAELLVYSEDNDLVVA